MNLTCLNHTLVYSDISFSLKGVQFRQFSLYIQIIHNNNTLFFLYLIAIHLCNTKHKKIIRVDYQKNSQFVTMYIYIVKLVNVTNTLTLNWCSNEFHFPSQIFNNFKYFLNQSFTLTRSWAMSIIDVIYYDDDNIEFPP